MLKISAKPDNGVIEKFLGQAVVPKSSRASLQMDRVTTQSLGRVVLVARTLTHEHTLQMMRNHS